MTKTKNLGPKGCGSSIFIDTLELVGCFTGRRGMMEDMERYYEIKKGTIPHHDNLLAISKPEDSGAPCA